MVIQTKVNAKVKIEPLKSQILLIILTIIAGLCLLIGFAFLWNDKPNSWIPLIIGVSLIGLIFYSWLKSQKDTDWENSVPTSFSDSSGNSIVTDTRALMTPESIQALAKLFQILNFRRPLPEADGLIDDQGRLVPNSAKEALEKVTQTNKEAQFITDKVIETIGISHLCKPQPIVAEASPNQVIVAEASTNQIIDTNIGI
jgi:hypothetical protein